MGRTDLERAAEYYGMKRVRIDAGLGVVEVESAEPVDYLKVDQAESILWDMGIRMETKTLVVKGPAVTRDALIRARQLNGRVGHSWELLGEAPAEDLKILVRQTPPKVREFTEAEALALR